MLIITPPVMVLVSWYVKSANRLDPASVMIPAMVTNRLNTDKFLLTLYRTARRPRGTICLLRGEYCGRSHDSADREICHDAHHPCRAGFPGSGDRLVYPMARQRQAQFRALRRFCGADLAFAGRTATPVYQDHDYRRPPAL